MFVENQSIARKCKKTLFYFLAALIVLVGISYWFYKIKILDTEVVDIPLGQLKGYTSEELYFEHGVCKRPINKSNCMPLVNLREQDYPRSTVLLRTDTKEQQQKKFFDNGTIKKIVTQLPASLSSHLKKYPLALQNASALLDNETVIVQNPYQCSDGQTFFIFNKKTQLIKKIHLKTFKRTGGNINIFDGYLILSAGNDYFSTAWCSPKIPILGWPLPADPETHSIAEVEYININNFLEGSK